MRSLGTYTTSAFASLTGPASIVTLRLNRATKGLVSMAVVVEVSPRSMSQISGAIVLSTLPELSARMVPIKNLLLNFFWYLISFFK